MLNSMVQIFVAASLLAFFAYLIFVVIMDLLVYERYNLGKRIVCIVTGLVFLGMAFPALNNLSNPDRTIAGGASIPILFIMILFFIFHERSIVGKE